MNSLIFGMWQNWVNGILGLWVILMNFLGFPATISKIILILTGLVIAVLAFWSASVGPKSERTDTAPGLGEKGSNETI